MASKKALNIVNPKDLSHMDRLNCVNSSKIELTDNQKRFSIVGIALNSVLIPGLQKYVDDRLQMYYRTLVTKYRINSDKSDLTFDVNKRDKLNLNFQPYEKVKENISNHNDLAKSYMRDFMMKKFKSITDKHTDASALLTILCQCPIFQSNGNLSRKVREEVRNEWGHCIMEDWDELKYLQCFRTMQEFVQSFDSKLLKNQAIISYELAEWQENGLKLIGKYVDPDLVKTVFDRISEVFAKRRDFIEIDEKNFDELSSQINQAAIKYDMLERKVFEIEQDNLKITENLSLQDKRIKKLEEDSKPNHNYLYCLPDKQAHFVGRENQIALLQQDLAGKNSKLIISGLGGIGKTSLALEIAWRERSNYKGGVFWVDADRNYKESLIPSLQGEERSLVIVDNLDNEDFSNHVRELIEGGWFRESNASILITSRLEERELNDILEHYVVHALEVLSVDDSITFLTKRVGRNLDQVDASNIVNELGCLPLALDQAAAYLRRMFPGIKLSDYLEKLKQEKIKQINRRKAKLPNTYVHDTQRQSVATTWSLNMQAIEEEFPVAETVMYIFSYLSPTGIPIEILDDKGNRLSTKEDLKSILKDEEERKYLLLLMTKMSLFDESVDQGFVKVHKLVQEIIRTKLKENPELHDEILCLVSDLLANSLSSSESPETLIPFLENGQETLHVRSLQRWGLLTENAGYFLDELKNQKLLNGNISLNTSLVDILDHAAMFFYLHNQTDRSNFYEKLMLNLMSKLNSNYYPQFKIPKFAKHKGKLSKLLNSEAVNSLKDTRNG